MKKEAPIDGFFHEPRAEQIREYARWPLERRLAWLLAGNRLRRCLPGHVREMQDRFRRGK